ncbi:hypothetical protein AVEN_40162-1 [Araneus ventricosus]|uniref:Uncharacterized protein n=1 Tax=Araneus ventricosus TaxID=182803 RepID=A0A4Y2PFV9_ARAVE|nr:hypothetical protein AVEN_40162-1 [Araneus ventricosus]
MSTFFVALSRGALFAAIGPIGQRPALLPLAPVVSADDESVRLVGSDLKVHETLSVKQPGSHETAGNYPSRAIFGCFRRIKQENSIWGRIRCIISRWRNDRVQRPRNSF